VIGGGRRLAASAAGVLLIGLALAGPGLAKGPRDHSPPAFAPGKWKGQITVTGTLSAPSTVTTGTGSGTFTLVVSRQGRVVDGSVHLTESYVTTSEDGTSTATSTADIPVVGPLSAPSWVVARGDVAFHVEFPPSLSVPPLDETVPGLAYLSPVTAGCNVIAGDAAVPARAAQAAAGLSTTVTATWTAEREGGRPRFDDAAVERALGRAVTALQRYLAQPKNNVRLADAAFAVEAVSDGVQSAAACRHAIPGMALGLLGNPTMRSLLKRFFAAALANHLSFDPGTLAHVLDLAVELGDEAQAQPLELAVEDLIARPPYSTDRAALQSILNGALAYGRSGLAQAASAALAKLP